MDQEREDYAEPPGSPRARRELAWGLGALLVPLLVAILLALWYLVGSLSF